MLLLLLWHLEVSEKAAEMHNGCDMPEGSLWFVCILTVGAVYPGGREGGRRNANNDKIKDEMTKK